MTTPVLVTEGSILYYVSLNLPESLKTPVLLLHALHGEINRIPVTCSDPGVARIKLEWWREELHRMRNQQAARHPLTQASQSFANIRPIDTRTLEVIIDETEQRIMPPDLRTRDDWRAFIDAGPALPWHSTAALLDTGQAATRDCVTNLIRAASWTECLQDFGLQARRGHCYFPDESLRDFGLQKNDVLAEPGSDKVAALLRNEYGQLVQQLEHNDHSLPRQDRRSQLPFLVLGRLSLALCREILRMPRPDPTCRTALTPLRRSWITWRTRLTNR